MKGIDIELSGSDVAIYLNGENSIRDGFLADSQIKDPQMNPIVGLVFEVRRNDLIRVVTLELRDVLEFNYSYSDQTAARVIAFVKCLMTDRGEFYLSLDPWDERECFISSEDNDFFRSGQVKLIESLKSSSE